MSTDIFSGLGNVPPASPSRTYLNGLGNYVLEILTLKHIVSEKPATKGNHIIAAEFAVREATDWSGAEAFAGYAGPHNVGEIVSFVANVTKTPMAFRDVRALIDACVPYLSEVLTDEEMAQIGKLEAEGGDVYEYLATIATSEGGDRFAGLKIRAEVRDSGKPDVTAYTRKYFRPLAD